jgi:hypothetical protein
MDDPALMRMLECLRDIEQDWNDLEVPGTAQPA